MQWLTGEVLAAVVRRLIGPLVGAVLALLVDAGLLDGAAVDGLVKLLSGL